MPVAAAGPVRPDDDPPFLNNRGSPPGGPFRAGWSRSGRLVLVGRRLLQVWLVLLAAAAVMLAYRSGASSGVTGDPAHEPVSTPAPVESADPAVGPAQSDTGLPQRPSRMADPRSGTGSVEVTASKAGDAGAESEIGPVVPSTVAESAKVQTTTKATVASTTPLTTTITPSTTTSSTVQAVAPADDPPLTSTEKPRTSARPTATSTTPATGPTARPDSASTEEDAITIDVLTNDAPGDGAIVASTLRIVAGPTNAQSATVTADHRIRYSPREWDGTDRLSYEICDINGLCDQATVTIAVSGD